MGGGGREPLLAERCIAPFKQFEVATRSLARLDRSIDGGLGGSQRLPSIGAVYPMTTAG